MATLTYVYADSTAVVGPLATASEPHAWDLCEAHGSRMTAPRGWEMVRHAGGFNPQVADEDDLTALAEAVREAGLAGRHRRTDMAGEFSAPPLPPPPPVPGRTGRRGHLRVLPDLPN